MPLGQPEKIIVNSTGAASTVQVTATATSVDKFSIIASDANTGNIHIGDADVDATEYLGVIPGDVERFEIPVSNSSSRLSLDLREYYIYFVEAGDAALVTYEDYS